MTRRDSTCGTCGGQVLGERQDDGWLEYTCLLCGRTAQRVPPERLQRWREEVEHVRTLDAEGQRRYWGGDRKLGRPLKVREPA